MTDSKKKELIERIAHSLDITPDMYNHSQSVVRGLTNYLINIDPSIEVYKQGSFKLGTIIRPYQKDKYGDFDIDLVVQFPSFTAISILPLHFGQYISIVEPSPALSSLYPHSGHTT